MKTMSDKNKYASLSKEIDDLKYSSGVGAKSAAGAKIFAKGLFNVGVFAFTEVLPKIVAQAEKQMAAQAENKNKSK